MAEGTDMNQIEKAMSDYLGEMCGMRLKPHALTGLAKAAIAAQSSIRAPRIGVRSTTQLSPPRPQEAVMQSDIVQCSLCAKLSPNMEQTAARTAAQIGCTMQCRECGRTYETQAAEITRLTEALRAAEEQSRGFRDLLVRAYVLCDGDDGDAVAFRNETRAALKGQFNDA